ncbi:MAG: BlaI/MecI/CopY family transcriptional regulator [Vicinamibacterales bacterium]
MARRPSPALTDAELRIMRVLWDRTRATVGEVVDGIEGPDRPAYNSVLTILRILERKGYVTHEKDGRAFVYLPIVDRAQARRSALSQLLSRFFNGSPEALVLDLLGHEQVDEEERRRVRDLLERSTPGDARSPRGPAGSTRGRIE